MRSMYDKLKLKDNKGRLLKQYHQILVDQQFRKDCVIWKEFLEEGINGPMNICRPFIDMDETQHARNLNFYTDAVKSPVFLVADGFVENSASNI